MRAWLLLPFLLLTSQAAHAADPCPQLAQQTPTLTGSVSAGYLATLTVGVAV